VNAWLAGGLSAVVCAWIVACGGNGPAVRPDAATPPPGPDAQALFARALAAQEAGDRDQAETLWKRVIVAMPNQAAPHTNLGILYRTTGRVGDAISEYQTAIRLDPSDSAAYHNLGLAHRARGQWADAERAYRRALELHPGQGDTHYNLGILYDLFLDRPEDALTQYRAVVALGGPHPDTVSQWIRTIERRLAQPEAAPPDIP
jgi:tetratricopeptide (TPR) repeat protein